MRFDNFFNGFTWLGVVPAALSSVKVLNTFLELGFKGIWADILDYYVRITEPVRELILKIPFLVEAPSWLPDILLLYTVMVMAGLRSTVLPYRFADYYRMHNTRKTYDVELPRRNNETFDVFLERQEESVREKAISAMLQEDKFIVKLRAIIPKWELVAIQSLKCLTLWPVVTLEPFRKMNKSTGSVRKMLNKAKPDNAKFVSADGRNYHAKWAVEVDNIRLNGFLQIVLLPILVALFLLGATYLS